MKKIHFISIQDTITVSLLIASKKIDYHLSISDKKISPDFKEDLIKNDISFNEEWHPEQITKNIDCVVLGTKVENNNPELLRAKLLNIKIFSLQQFINYLCTEKTRVLVAGTYGKTSVISIVMHVLKFHNFSVDHIINKKISGIESLISLSKENDFIIIEGNENILPEINEFSKDQFFNPHVVLITCVFWKYIKTYPSFESYKKYFNALIDNIIPGGTLIHNINDQEINTLVNESIHTIRKESYSNIKSEIINGIVTLETEEGNYPIKNHNDYSLINLGGAIWLCQLIGIDHSDFYEAIISYRG